MKEDDIYEDLDFPQLQQGAVTDVDRPIFDQRLRLFYIINLYLLFGLSDLKSTTEI
jgi:hypothetical protein